MMSDLYERIVGFDGDLDTARKLLSEAAVKIRELETAVYKREFRFNRERARRDVAISMKDIRDIEVAKSLTICEEVASEYGIKLDALLESVKRAKGIKLRARQLAMFRVYEETALSTPEIAKLFNCRDHVLVLYHVKRARQRETGYVVPPPQECRKAQDVAPERDARSEIPVCSDGGWGRVPDPQQDQEHNDNLRERPRARAWA